MLLRTVLAALLFLPACVLPGTSPWNGLHASGRAAFFPVSGEFDTSSTAVSSGGSTEFDGAVDLNSDESSSFLLGGRVGFAPFELSVSTFGYEGSHSGRVTGGTVFDGQSLGGPTDYDIDADMELGATQALLGFDLVNLPPGRVALLLGVDFLDFDTLAFTLPQSVGGVPAGTRQDLLVDEQVPLPVVGVRGDVWLPFDLSLGGTLAGGALEYDDVDYTMFDLDVALAWEPGYHVQVLLGYRIIEVSLDGVVEGVTADADLGFDGPYLGVEVYF